MRSGTLGELLADGGAVGGGGAAHGATVFFVAGSLVHDFGADIDPEAWARRGGLLGGAFGLVVFLEGA
jgi:hypothetical protein